MPPCKRHPVHDVRHAELAHAVGDVVARRLLEDMLAAGPVGQVRAGQVGGTADELGQVRRQRVDRDLARLARGHRLGLRIHRGDGLFRDFRPARGQFASHAALELRGLGRIGLRVMLELAVPGFFPGGAFLARIPGLIDFLRNLEGREIPADVRTHGGAFRFAQRRAVHVVGAGLVRAAGADDGLALDEGRPIGHRLGFFDRLVDGFRVMTIHIADHMPAIGFEALAGIVGEPALDMAIDRDAIVVPEGGELPQPPGAGQRAGFVRNALHQAAVAEEHPGAVIDDLMAGTIEFGGEQLFRHRHAHRVGNALTERSGGRLDARRIAIFRMPGVFECSCRNCLMSSIVRS
jgi:hypothetical protein